MMSNAGGAWDNAKKYCEKDGTKGLSKEKNADGSPSATLDDLREAVTTLVETDRIARRVLGTAHPLTKGIEGDLQYARAALDARETPPSSGN